MDIRDVLLLVDGETKAAGPYALAFASRLGAHLTAVAFVFERPFAGPFSELPHNLADAMYEESLRSAEQALNLFENVVDLPGVETKIITVPSGESAENHFRWLARHFDLTVAQQPSDELGSASMVEAALFGSGRPILLVPYIHTAPAHFETVLIAWDESATAARAIGDSLPLLRLANRVELVMVAEARSEPNDRPAPRIVEHLRRHGIEARFVALPRSVGVAEVLLSHAADIAAELLIMGGMAIRGCASLSSAEQLDPCLLR